MKFRASTDPALSVSVGQPGVIWIFDELSARVSEDPGGAACEIIALRAALEQHESHNRCDARASLAQEIRGALKAHGHWCPDGQGPDIITAVGLALQSHTEALRAAKLAGWRAGVQAGQDAALSQTSFESVDDPTPSELDAIQ
jgi:hypothetical protein